MTVMREREKLCRRGPEYSDETDLSRFRGYKDENSEASQAATDAGRSHTHVCQLNCIHAREENYNNSQTILF